MNLIRKFFVVFMLLVCVSVIQAQVQRQFNGVVNVDATINIIIPGIENHINAAFNDPGGRYSGSDAQVGDKIVDSNGNSFQITIISSSDAGNIECTIKPLDGLDIAAGSGLIYRNSPKGIDVLGLANDPVLVGTVTNSAILTIDSRLPTVSSGTTAPSVSYAVGDIVLYSGSVYKFNGTGWDKVTGISDSFGLDPGNPGDIAHNVLDDGYYVCAGGTSWNLISTATSLPTPSKLGDIFYNTSENQLYMMGSNGTWMAISSTSIPAGPVTNFPTSPKIGDFFFDNVNNVLYVYDALGRWVQVSINGSTPSGIMNPDPLVSVVKEGEIFYNTTDHKPYIYNGSTWISLSNSLTSGQIFIGNSSNVPVSVPLTGDATISSIGKLTISNSAVTDTKLDKANIPINGFGYANNNIVIGTTSPFYQIKGVANPTNPEDVATKSYVDLSFASPFMLGLANSSVFVGNASNKATAILKSNVPISDFGKAGAAVSMGIVGGPYYNINNMANPTNPQDAATKFYVDTHMVTPAYITLANNQLLVGTPGGVATATAKSTLPFSDFGAATTDVLMGGKSLKNLHDPTSAQDAATKGYVDSKTLTLTSNYVFQGDATNTPVGMPKNAIPLSDWGTATSNVSMGGTNLTDLADPRLTAAGLQDAATRNYVDKKMGSTTTGPTPPASPTIGTTYYNTTDKILYVYDGTGWIPVNNVLPNGQFYVGDASNKATPTAKSAISLSGFGDAAANVSMGTGSNNYRIINVADPAGDQDASTKKYVDSKAGTSPSGPTPPTTPTVGSTYYNTIDKTLYVYDGTQWTPVGNNTLPTGQLYVGDATNKAAATAKNTIPLSGFAAAAADIDLGVHKIINVVDPTGNQDAATKKYVDGKAGSVTTGTTPPASPTVGTTYYNTTDKTFYVYDGTQWLPVNNILPTGQLYVGDASNKAAATAKSAVPLSGFGTPTSNIDFGTFKITSLGDPTADQEAATKKYVDGKIGSVTTGTTPPASPTVGTTYYNTTDKTFYVYDGTQWLPVNNILPTGQLYVGDASNKAAATAKNTIPLSGFAAATADIDLGTHKIANVVDPVANQDAATKKYVDGKVGSVTTGTTPPASPTTGTTYYNTTDKTFYVYDGTGWVPVNNILPSGELYVGDASNKAVPVAKSAITLSGFGDAQANISMGTGSNNYKVINVADPTGDQDAATKKYVDGKAGSVTTGTTPPASPTVGTTYYNTTDKTFYVYDGTQWLPVNNILPTGQLYVGDASNKAAATAKNTIPLSGFAAAAADIDLGTHKINNVVDPTANQDAATKKYVDGKIGSVTTGTTPPTSPTTGTTYYNTTDKTFYVYDGTQWLPVNNILPTGQLYVGDASNKAAATAKNTIPLSGFGTPTSNIDFGAFKITSLGDPTADQEAATKKYVDSKIGSVTTGTTPPASPTIGTTYYNTVDKLFYVYDGTQWLPVNNILPSGEFYVGDASNKAVPIAKSAITLSGFGDAQANISMGTGSNNYKVINVADPTGDQDAATKKYVDTKTGAVTTGTTPPPGPTTGTTYYNTTDKILYVYDGTQWIPAVPGDNLGNHTATQNLKMSTYAISNDGVNGKGLTFETAGNAIFAQDVTVQGNFYTPSDKRLKTNIETLGNALQAIDSMRGVRFEYKEQKKYAKGPKIGVIAQELLKVYPEMVTKGTDGFFKVDYTQLTGVLIQAVKEQQQKMKQQQLEIDELKNRLDKQQMQINAILKKIN